jgi:hypothetical protein
VAMTARRLGAEQVDIVSLEQRNDLPAQDGFLKPLLIWKCRIAKSTSARRIIARKTKRGHSKTGKAPFFVLFYSSHVWGYGAWRMISPSTR